MAIAITVEDFLDRHHIAHEVVSHAPSSNSMDTARTAHISPERIAKGVLLNADGHYVLAVTRADRQIDLDELRRQLQAPVSLASTDDLEAVFDDCDRGAVPPLGPAYGVETIWDEDLCQEPDLYFELGDHRHLVHLNTRDYLGLLGDEHRASFSEPMRHLSSW